MESTDAIISGSPSRMQSAVFLPLEEEGRTELVERRIAEAINGGVLQPGERLPSETDLARTLRVSLVTVREALVSLRERGLITTRRGRHGGSFVTDDADPATFAERRLMGMSRLALRDLGEHYLAIGGACAALAAARADPSEIATVRRHLDRGGDAPHDAWTRLSDEIHLEIAALSQSARLTREHMRLHSEFSPLLALADDDGQRREEQIGALTSLLLALENADAAEAARTFSQSTRRTVEWLIQYRQGLLDSAGEL